MVTFQVNPERKSEICNVVHMEACFIATEPAITIYVLFLLFYLQEIKNRRLQGKT